MGSMKRPPIPPNCPFFKKDIRGTYNFVFRDVYYSLCGRLHQQVRTVITAVARCAWLDEARRIESIRRKKEYCHKRTGRITVAYEHAEKWRKWGEQ